jgi:hypothetical protein
MGGFKISANEKVLWQVGDLKLVRPNVCRVKLLIFNDLQMIGSFRPPKQKYKRIPNVQLLPSAPTCHNTMLSAAAFCVSLRIRIVWSLNNFLNYNLETNENLNFIHFE